MTEIFFPPKADLQIIPWGIVLSRTPPTSLGSQPCLWDQGLLLRSGRTLLGEMPGERGKIGGSPPSGHRTPDAHSLPSAGKTRKLAKVQSQTAGHLSLFFQEAFTFQPLPGSQRHSHEALITRTERSSLLEPAGWSLFPLPFVFMHHSLTCFSDSSGLWKKPQMLHTAPPPSRLADSADTLPCPKR